MLTMDRPKRTKADAIPPLSADPEYAAESKRLYELRTEAGRLEQRLDALRVEQASRNSTGRVHADARALLANSGVEEFRADAEIIEDVNEMLHRLRVHREAIELQERRVASVQQRVSLAVVEAARPQYVDILTRMAAAAVELGRLSGEERAFREQLDGHGYPASMLSPHPMPLMNLDDEYSRLRYWLKEVERDHGIKAKV